MMDMREKKDSRKQPAISDHDAQVLYATQLFKTAGLYKQSRKYQTAELLLTEASAIYERVYGTYSLDVFDCLVDLADIFQEQGKVQEAKKTHSRATKTLTVLADQGNEKAQELLEQSPSVHKTPKDSEN